MTNTREKLIELLNNSFDEQYSKRGLLTAPHTADHLIASGVTLDNQVSSSKWIPVTERLPHRNMECICRYRFCNDDQYFHQVLEYFATDKKPHFQHELGGSGLNVTH